jgi:hypothetical protein
MRGLLGAIAADRHAAPVARFPSGVIDKHQRADRRSHVGKVLHTGGIGDKHCGWALAHFARPFVVRLSFALFRAQLLVISEIAVDRLLILRQRNNLSSGFREVM